MLRLLRKSFLAFDAPRRWVTTRPNGPNNESVLSFKSKKVRFYSFNSYNSRNSLTVFYSVIPSTRISRNR